MKKGLAAPLNVSADVRTETRLALEGADPAM
jgi:hypothetical protein